MGTDVPDVAEGVFKHARPISLKLVVDRHQDSRSSRGGLGYDMVEALNVNVHVDGGTSLGLRKFISWTGSESMMRESPI